LKNKFETGNYYPGIDGLRGLAVILVLIYHNSLYLEITWYGQFGVDLFFVISGFLITEILLKSINSAKYFTNFYGRRLMRIFPIYYLCLAIIFFILPDQLLLDASLKVSRTDQWWFWTYLQNWFFATKGISIGTAPITHFWTLAVEEQFYLLWPPIILLIRDLKKLLLICITILIAINLIRFFTWLYFMENIDQLSYTFTRCDGILAGSILAVLKQTGQFQKSILLKKTSFILILLNGIYLLLGPVFDIRPNYLNIAGYTSISIFFTWVLYLTILNPRSILQKALTVSPLKFFGKYSYGIYVFHFPVMFLLHPITEKWLWPLFGSRIPETLLLISIEVIIAVIIYHLYEKHFLKLKKFFSYA
jgi:peptidoglycan/LPS O-acetylase OafA/YrhL